ncbi:MAG: 50S ribosomal protein L18e [Sulfolobales archaeon]|nr:50S ribosomal protein L18e [Sulfolobales archaeon]MCX8208831.1 50S ribosomal protein L18e [Sulfolobales archaeon]MDW8010144.1 50S ribosomal protein L18e [Sulfolobales archaeon]
MKRTGPTNLVLRKLIRELRKSSNQYSVGIWDYVAELLEKPSRERVVVNLSKLNRCCGQGEYVVVPGKVLGSGDLEKPLLVAAVSFSKKAVEKIRKAGGSTISIPDLLKINPRGSNVRVVV